MFAVTFTKLNPKPREPSITAPHRFDTREEAIRFAASPRCVRLFNVLTVVHLIEEEAV